MTKRKGLADRIRDQRKVSVDDRLKEKLLLNQVINFSSLEVKDQDSIASGSSKDHDSITSISSKDQDSIASGSSKDHDSITSISSKDQDGIASGSSKDHDSITSISSKDQDGITSGSSKDHDSITSISSKDQDGIASGSSKDHDSIASISNKDQDGITSGSSKDHDSITSISSKDQDGITSGSSKDHDSITSISSKDQDGITSGSSKDHDSITSISSKDQDGIISGLSKDQESITSISSTDQDNIRSLSDKDQINIRSISDKDQDSINLGSCLKKNYVIADNCIDLTSTQMKVYNWFKDNGQSGYFNKTYISKDTDITYITIRKIIKKFKDTELLFFGNYDPTIRLETYKFNDQKKGICGIEITGQKDIINRQNNALISSSKFLKTNELTKAYTENPELEYWAEKKLKATKVKAWMSEFNMSEEDMIESLCHCAFELKANGELDKKGQPIANVMDWFYSIIKKYHYYDKPAKYKSIEEKTIERAEKRLKEKQEKLKRIHEIEKAEREADIELKFLEMMSDPSGILFEKCYEGLTDFTKKRYVKPEKRQGAMFEKEMKISFKKILENEE